MNTERKIMSEPIIEVGEIEAYSETISTRGMTAAIEQRLENQLLPPIDKKLRKEWKILRKAKAQ